MAGLRPPLPLRGLDGRHPPDRRHATPGGTAHPHATPGGTAHPHAIVTSPLTSTVRTTSTTQRDVTALVSRCTTCRLPSCIGLQPANSTCAPTGSTRRSRHPSRSAVRSDRPGARSATMRAPGLRAHRKVPESSTGHRTAGCSLGYGLVPSPMPLLLAWRSVSPVYSGLCASCVDLASPSVTGAIHQSRQLHQEPEQFSGADV
jgi:hypothetical protein